MLEENLSTNMRPLVGDFVVDSEPGSGPVYGLNSPSEGTMTRSSSGWLMGALRFLQQK